MTRASVVTAGARYEMFVKVLRKIWRPFGVLVDAYTDARYGVETGGYHPLAKILPAGHEGKYCVWYQPTPWSVARIAIQHLPISYDQFCFIDYGSGKGRVLLVASTFPFRRVIGVELSPILHTTAIHNIRTWTALRRHKVVPESICVDAQDFEPPLEPVVAFLFTPFKGPVFEAVIRKFAKPERMTLPTIITYYGANPTCLQQCRNLRWYERCITPPRNLVDLAKYRLHYFSNNAELLPADGSSHHA